jgi:hypothetical protein
MNAAFCCAPLSVNPTVRHVDYIGSCLEVLRETRAIVRIASQARRTADQLLALPRRLQQSAIWTISQATGRWHALLIDDLTLWYGRLDAVVGSALGRRPSTKSLSIAMTAWTCGHPDACMIFGEFANTDIVLPLLVPCRGTFSQVTERLSLATGDVPAARPTQPRTRLKCLRVRFTHQPRNTALWCPLCGRTLHSKPSPNSSNADGVP